MGAEREKRFYWVEGVTRDEVVKSLSDRRPTRLREQGVRRALVAIYGGLVVILPAIQVWVPGRKAQSYLEIFPFIGLFVFFFVLQRSVRHIADAPDELLDERLISMRNAAYVLAYRWLAWLVLPFMVVFYRLGGQGNPGTRVVSGVVLPLMMLAAALPSMVLAWQLPSERLEEVAGKE